MHIHAWSIETMAVLCCAVLWLGRTSYFQGLGLGSEGLATNILLFQRHMCCPPLAQPRRHPCRGFH